VKLRGTVHRYGDNVNTDVILPARYLDITNAKELATHCMEDLDSGFTRRVKPGDIIVADRNFGCGSSREHAPVAIKAAGIDLILARSFARIFFRNALNIGLPVLEVDNGLEEMLTGDVLEVELERGTIANLTRGCALAAKPYPPFMMRLISAGGLVEYTRSRIAVTDRR